MTPEKLRILATDLYYNSEVNNFKEILQALQSVADESFEEAAKVADKHKEVPYTSDTANTAEEIADEIRALKTQPAGETK